MKFYPVYLELRDRPCLVIGGGAVAERKTLSLLEAGAEVTIISPTLTAKLAELAASAKIAYREGEFDEKDILGEFLVVAATNSADMNTRVAEACRKKNVLVNSAVPPDESSFIVPSVVERGGLLIAVSTSGTSPALAKKIRQELEERYGPEYEMFLERLSAIRKRVLDEVDNEERRKAIFEALVDSNALELLRQGRTHEADMLMHEIAGLKRRT